MPAPKRRTTQTTLHEPWERDLGLSQRLDHFTWPWFTCTMSTASLAVLLSEQPYTFSGLNAIGKIYFLLALTLFICFSAVITYRFAREPSKLWMSMQRPKEGLFFGSYWVTVGLLLTCMQQYGVPSTGPWLVKALEVLFWIYAGCVMIVTVMQYSIFFIAERVPVRSVMPAWIFPVYPFLILGTLAAVLIPSQPPAAGLNIFVGGIMFQGLGWCVSFFLYTIFLVRLVSSELPAPSSRPGMFICVGPAGYTSAAFIALGMQAQTIVPREFLEVYNFDVGASLKIVGILAGIFLWLLSAWFFALAAIAVATGARTMSFTLTWWAFIFPNCGLTLATIKIGTALESPAIKIVTSVVTCLLVLLWFWVAVVHIRAVARKKVLWPGKDEDFDTNY